MSAARKWVLAPLTLRATDLRISEIGTALSRINRYVGWGKFPYSVAQHSALLSEVVPPGLRLAALVHDTPELSIGDMPSPFRDTIPQIAEREKAIMAHLGRLFGVPYSKFLEVTFFDHAIRGDEMFALDLLDSLPKTALRVSVIPMTPEEAAEFWVRRFYQINSGETSI